MGKDLKWIRYSGTNLNLKIDAFKLNTINNFYQDCAAHDDSDPVGIYYIFVYLKGGGR